MWHNHRMPNVNIRQLRDTRKLKAWLRAGKTVELRDRNKVIARIVPAEQQETTVAAPGFAAPRKKNFGGRGFSGAANDHEGGGRFFRCTPETAFSLRLSSKNFTI